MCTTLLECLLGRTLVDHRRTYAQVSTLTYIRRGAAYVFEAIGRPVIAAPGGTGSALPDKVLSILLLTARNPGSIIWFSAYNLTGMSSPSP